ncbi:type II toxin-antitoxin system VapC family toxin [Nocardia cyriacigeorgica]|uniref:type II toxin-antitoxin system VapC family toxin n=1 Tax=Nocardia cyriacigeorgica TaxID=135487 RepID=UPI001893C1BC|nr:type II toxin-antitoxin system VapC family toxin [Nocardia cyriacigeorgica]MBF6453644.1 type II toxin-antitoxin system VapC family toxin [Nocardia cyriacigeorgica]MBF6478911.1 type II toxin-antitoxin system VapC family toxin [Nocardia cyriacigeorgica]MBF6550812.1 type II toxin-antitoxin system VapC family toxin [Nocardia cyriacigeorgica]
MSLLLDTHVALWWLEGNPVLSDELVDALNHEPDVYLSAATVWEVAIKQALGKLDGPPDLPEQLRHSGFDHLPIDHRHGIVAGRLPLIHRDPFDRILVAQAQCEGLRLVTRDPWCHKYDVDILPA